MRWEHVSSVASLINDKQIGHSYSEILLVILNWNPEGMELIFLKHPSHLRFVALDSTFGIDAVQSEHSGWFVGWRFIFLMESCFYCWQLKSALDFNIYLFRIYKSYFDIIDTKVVFIKSLAENYYHFLVSVWFVDLFSCAVISSIFHHKSGQVLKLTLQSNLILFLFTQSTFSTVLSRNPKVPALRSFFHSSKTIHAITMKLSDFYY